MSTATIKKFKAPKFRSSAPRSKAKRRAHSARVAAADKLRGQGDQIHSRAYQLVVELAGLGGHWDHRTPGTPAQKVAVRMFRLAGRATAAIDGWERREPWATTERVEKDCETYAAHVVMSALDIRVEGARVKLAAGAPIRALQLLERVAAAQGDYTAAVSEACAAAEASPGGLAQREAFYQAAYLTKRVENAILFSTLAIGAWQKNRTPEAEQAAVQRAQEVLDLMLGARAEIAKAGDARAWQADAEAGRNVVSLAEVRAARRAPVQVPVPVPSPSPERGPFAPEDMP